MNADRRTAVAPAGAPEQVVAAVAAANRITLKPYKWGGGHGRWRDSGYDCSGTVSYVLHAAGLLKQARDSGGLMSYGERGKGAWITVYAHGGHAYMTIAGLRFDTSGRGEEGPRWRLERRSGTRLRQAPPRRLVARTPGEGRGRSARSRFPSRMPRDRVPESCGPQRTLGAVLRQHPTAGLVTTLLLGGRRDRPGLRTDHADR